MVDGLANSDSACVLAGSDDGVLQLQDVGICFRWLMCEDSKAMYKQ